MIHLSMKKFIFLLIFILSCVSFAGNKRIIDKEVKKLNAINDKILAEIKKMGKLEEFNNKTVYLKVKIYPIPGKDDFKIDIKTLSLKEIKKNANTSYIKAVIKKDENGTKVEIKETYIYKNKKTKFGSIKQEKINEVP